MYKHFLKRVADIVISLTVLLIVMPIMVIVAIMIRIDSRGPALFFQERVGLNGKTFRMIKFRSMIVGAENKGAGYGFEKDDSRITKLGKWLRKASLDELPQLWNILIGQMSIIGPRPGLPYQAASYTSEQKRRLSVRPGITGWAQINGRNEIPWSKRIELDLWYVDHISLRLDVKILIKTINVVLLAKGFKQDQQSAEVDDITTTTAYKKAEF